MFKNLILFFLPVLLSLSTISQNLYNIDIDSQKEQNKYLSDPGFSVHYINDNFLIGSGHLSDKDDYRIIENDTWKKGKMYSVIWLPEQDKDLYILRIKQHSEILFINSDYLICKTDKNSLNNLKPAVHSGIVKINPFTVYNKQKQHNFNKLFNPDPLVEGYVAEVVTDSIMEDIQFMEDYGTRYYNSSQATEAQNWIKRQFENYGLSVELTETGAGGSMNVTAYQTGLVYPNTYIMVGGHYDSTSYGGTAPGADDNASGTSGVLEIARILSQYEFNYSIIYCAWSAEEIGLVGSGTWASNAANAGTDIIGYLNLDMTGYLHPGDDLHACMIAPSSAQPLVDFYYDIVDMYITDFTVFDGFLSGGDSDHTSFNNNGYQGIFPFEDDENYSPYIHSENDLIGPSVNSPEKSTKFTQAGVAFIAAAAEPFTGLFPPMNLVLTQLDDQVLLDWEAPLNQIKDFTEYRLYRNSELYETISDVNQINYTDVFVENGVTYEYFVTAFYSGSSGGESPPSNTVNVTMGLNQIYFWDFEDGIQNWTILNTTLGWQWGVPADLSGNNTEYLSINSDAPGSAYHVFDYAISPELDLNSYSIAILDFDFGYKNYSSDFLKLMYRTSPTSNWTEIEELSESTSFIHHSVEFPDEALTETMQFSFYYDDNNVWAWYAGIDNVEINAAEPESGVSRLEEQGANLSVYPNPVSSTATIEYFLYESSDVVLSLYDFSGKLIEIIEKENKLKGKYNVQFLTEKLNSGIYFYKLKTSYGIYTHKTIVIK